MSFQLILAAFLADVNIWYVFLAALIAMAFFSMVILLKSNYKRCSSNQVLVIFGKTGQGQAAKTVHGGAAFVWPLFQDYRYLSRSRSKFRSAAPCRSRIFASTSPASSPSRWARSRT
jgi:uncharacterized membrane protein YqiK